MDKRVKVSSKHQIAVPSAVRRELGIKAGDYLLMGVRDGVIVLMPEPQDWVETSRGLGRDVWEGVDPVAYVRGERGACPTS
jgi:AbrB family looped-hinge helix DNA binding protein